MRQADKQDILKLTDIYEDARLYGEDVGVIDWPKPINELFIQDLIATNELYCFDSEDRVVAAAKLSTNPDVRIWGSENIPALYLAKLATSSEVRGRGYLRHEMIPAIQNYAGQGTALRLECLAENSKLISFYQRLGFTALGEAQFYSDKQLSDITVMRFEKQASV